MGCTASTSGVVNDNGLLRGLYSTFPNHDIINNDNTCSSSSNNNNTKYNNNNKDHHVDHSTNSPTTTNKRGCQETVIQHSLFLLCQSSPSPSPTTMNTNRVHDVNHDSSAIKSNDNIPTSVLQTPQPSVPKGKSYYHRLTDDTSNSIMAPISADNTSENVSDNNSNCAPSLISASFISLSSSHIITDDDDNGDEFQKTPISTSDKDASAITTSTLSIIMHHVSNNNIPEESDNKNCDDYDNANVEEEENDDDDDEFLFSPKTSINISRELLDYSHLSDSYILEQKRSHQPPRRLFDEEEEEEEDNEGDEGGEHEEEDEDDEGDMIHLSTSSILFMSMSNSLLDAETSFESCSGMNTSFESTVGPNHGSDT